MYPDLRSRGNVLNLAQARLGKEYTLPAPPQFLNPSLKPWRKDLRRECLLILQQQHHRQWSQNVPAMTGMLSPQSWYSICKSRFI